MGCTVTKDVDCKFASAGLAYHGEKCLGCLFWKDEPADIEFKLWVCGHLTRTPGWDKWLANYKRKKQESLA